MASSPPPDNSPGLFSGEWAGTGAQSAYCYLKMDADGRGLVLIDGGTGDWLGARIHWRNRHQALEIEKIIPLQTSSQLRIMPLEHFTLNAGFNQSLHLSWSKTSDGCYLQKIEASQDRLANARNVMNKLRSSKGVK